MFVFPGAHNSIRAITDDDVEGNANFTQLRALQRTGRVFAVKPEIAARADALPIEVGQALFDTIRDTIVRDGEWTKGASAKRGKMRAPMMKVSNDREMALFANPPANAAVTQVFQPNPEAQDEERAALKNGIENSAAPKSDRASCRLQ